MPLLDVFCPNGHPVPADAPNARFCRVCGEPLLSHCPEGHTSKASGKFCTTCGTSMESGAVEPPAPVQAVIPVPASVVPESPILDRGEDAATVQVETPTAVPDEPTYMAPLPPLPMEPTSTQSGYAVGQPYDEPHKTIPAFAPVAPLPAHTSTSRGWVVAVVIAAILVLGLAGGLVYVLKSKNNTPANSATVTTFHSTTFHSTTPTTTHGATTHGATRRRATTTTTPQSEQVAAGALAALLTQSVADRSDINAASNDVTSCGPSLAQDGQVFENAAGSRQQLITQLSTLPGASTLPSTMIQDLTDAWQASAQVDDDYARWANDESSSGCTPNDTADPNYQAATTPNQQATQNKMAFAALWDSIATQYNLTSYQWNQL
jgi:uncharacterized membrane protein